MARYIDADKLPVAKEYCVDEAGFGASFYVVHKEDIDKAPTVDAVEVEKYNDLREAFVDFVCSGVHNPAPYCKNACEECVDSYGWCTYRKCNGFNPDGERRSGDE